MDLSPFLRINPCGYAGMNMVQCSDLNGPPSVTEAGAGLVKHMLERINAEHVEYTEGFENE